MKKYPTMKKLTRERSDCPGVYARHVTDGFDVDFDRSCDGCTKCAAVYMALVAKAYDQLKLEGSRLVIR